MTSNANDNHNDDIEIVANVPSYDEGLEDVTELPFGEDEEYRSSNSSMFNSKRNKLILVVIATILLLCVTGFSAAAVSRNNTIRSFQSTNSPSKASKAPKSSKAPQPSKAPKATIGKGSKAPAGV
eukprot:CAMPEP_0201724484 /NCGR_PEP_ID=MMETSP0593-20130828/8227_1 /ASSEMBLY_ACC=CAM_ASM_000672 /TAXON_ID=267983 /ORGANISM="Skeletonema japonicum, Strain CCMP2506" /LENGTH=124 /DNA_ID=CAMNT_0048215761 /DNA_START=94 /DNA_END=468 /DNA_ORIENTATION=+